MENGSHTASRCGGGMGHQRQSPSPPPLRDTQSPPLRSPQDEIRQLRGMVNAAVQERKKLHAHLKAERELCDQLRMQMSQKDDTLTNLRRAIIEASNGLDFTSYEKEGRQMVEIKGEIGGDDKYEVQVDLLTALLKSTGQLERVIQELRELEDPTAMSFGAVTMKKGKPVADAKMEKPLISQMQLLVDAGQFQRKAEELQAREHKLKIKEYELEEKEKLVHGKFKAMQEASWDPLVKIMEEQKARLRQLYDEAWMRGVEQAYEEAVAMHTSDTPPRGHESMDIQEDNFEGIELSPNEEDVRTVCGEESELQPTSEERTRPIEDGKYEDEEVELIMRELQQYQMDCNCLVDVAEFVKTYVTDSVLRKQTGGKYRPIKEFFYAHMVCDRCLHRDPPRIPRHLSPRCAELCCGLQRCERCLHVHIGEACPCDHACRFLQWLEKRLTGE